MIRIHIQTTDYNLRLPIPYLCMTTLCKMAQITHTASYIERKIPMMPKFNTILYLVRHCKKYKGLHLMDLSTKDGTTIQVRL